MTINFYQSNRKKLKKVNKTLQIEMSSCIFCDIAEKKSPETVIEFENDELIIFKDIRPAAEHHFLAAPKIHYDSVKSLNKEEHLALSEFDKELMKPFNDVIIFSVNNLESSLKDLLQSRGVDVNDALYGFHWPPFISVKHLHMHAMAPASEMTFKSRMIFKPNSMWFSTVGIFTF